jgi:hypothetical protein
VVWFEIGTTEPEAATGFYGPLLGWSFDVDEDSSIDGRTYIRILAPARPGRWARSPTDVTATVDTAQRSGARVERGPESTPTARSPPASSTPVATVSAFLAAGRQAAG